MASTARRRLRALFDAGALAGRTDADSFFVRCDAGTHTQADLDAGRAVLQVGVAPAVRPSSSSSACSATAPTSPASR